MLLRLRVLLSSSTILEALLDTALGALADCFDYCRLNEYSLLTRFWHLASFKRHMNTVRHVSGHAVSRDSVGEDHEETSPFLGCLT